MSVGKLATWGTIAASICTLVYFWGDIHRYTKMKRM
jgi:hypothetical protein